MPPPAAVEGGEAGGGERQQQQQGVGQMFTGIIRIAVIYYFASKFFSSNKPSSSGSGPSVQISNLFQKSESLDMWFYLSEHEKFNEFGNEDLLIWHESNIPYAVWGPESTKTLSLKYYPSEALKHNGSLFAHVFFAPVVTYLPKSKANKKKSLLGNSKDSSEDDLVSEGVEKPQADLKDDGPAEYISYWKPNEYVVDDFTKYSQRAIPPNVAPYMNIEPTAGNYYPTVYFNEFWLLRDKLIAINDTVTELPLHLEVAPISMMTQWQLFLQIDQSF
ncbi:hypothetical protein L1987_46037 [Smallanthus sonchifolius]|uniref:Uncharacterized protein n=1 Tax=Smallanthus sonchifolius TaxID=185202 RepID=A0ACB9FZ96_9ASTR|nr:hypothetical protein L1987_46037 [Smallanthus sonchifolius]